MTKNVLKFTFKNAMPFWCSVRFRRLGFFTVWYLFSVLDLFTGLNLENADPDTEDDDLFWYRLITVIWAPLQFVTLFGLLLTPVFYVALRKLAGTSLAVEPTAHAEEKNHA